MNGDVAHSADIDTRPTTDVALTALFDTALAYFAIAGTDGFFRRVNPAFEHLLGYQGPDLIGRSLFELVHLADINPTLEGFLRMEDGVTEVAFENRLRHRDGSYRWLSWVAHYDPGTRVWAATARDVTSYRALEQTLDDLRARLRLALGACPAGGWEWVLAQSAVMLDTAAVSILKMGTADENGPAGVSPSRLLWAVARVDRRRLLHALRTLLPARAEADSPSLPIEIELKLANGTHVSVRAEVTAIDRRGRPTRLLGLIRDVSTGRALEEQLIAMAMSDSLTGLANRRHFQQRLRAEWRRGAREKKPLAVVMLDVDDFKRFNDTHGHLAGDQVLSAVASCLSTATRRPADLAGRYGGEEFALLLPGTDMETAAMLAEAVRREIEKLAIFVGEKMVSVTASIGVASMIPRNQGPPEELVGVADQAMYRAKRAGKNRVERFLEAEASVTEG